MAAILKISKFQVANYLFLCQLYRSTIVRNFMLVSQFALSSQKIEFIRPATLNYFVEFRQMINFRKLSFRKCDEVPCHTGNCVSLASLNTIILSYLSEFVKSRRSIDFWSVCSLFGNRLESLRLKQFAFSV